MKSNVTTVLWGCDAVQSTCLGANDFDLNMLPRVLHNFTGLQISTESLSQIVKRTMPAPDDTRRARTKTAALATSAPPLPPGPLPSLPSPLPSMSIASAPLPPDAGGVLLPHVQGAATFYTYSAAECRQLLAHRDNEIDDKQQEIERLRRSRAHYVNRCQDLKNQLVTLRDDSTELQNRMNMRPGRVNHNGRRLHPRTRT